MNALEIHDLEKTYRNNVQALKGVSFNVESGDFFALLGPNGAGKSTLISILTSLVNKSSGKVKIYGHDIDHEIAAAKACLGVVPQEFNFNIFESVFNILIYQAGFYGIPRKIAVARAEKYLRQLGLWEKRHSVSRLLSGGMKRRLMIARALIHEPQMLVLDEPTAGVDIEIRRSMWEFLTQLNQQGITIILTTHYLEEAERLCRNIAIIDLGEIIEYRSMSNFLQKLDRERFIFYLESPYEHVPQVPGYDITPVDENAFEVEVSKNLGLSNLFEKLKEQGVRVSSMRNKTNRLEELFLNLTKRSE